MVPDVESRPGERVAGQPIRLLIVDDNDDMRLVLRLSFRQAGDIVVVGEAADAPTAIRLLHDTDPDLVLLDHRLPGRSGLDVAAELRDHRPGVGILLYSAYVDDELASAAEAAGIPVVTKDRVAGLTEAIRRFRG